MKITISCACFALLILFSQAHAKETRYLMGNGADVQPKLHGPALDLAGGSTDVKEAMQWMIDEVRGCTDCQTKLDVVVLRSSGAEGYNPLIVAMNGVDSVETLVITSRADADSKEVGETVRNAEVVFFAGGDQCNYVTYFKGTAVEKGVEAVYLRGGGVGGTSAGLAILGSAVYDACPNSSAQSPASLQNPYYPGIHFTYDFFNWKFLDAIITDTHFVKRDRMGRTLAFLARQIADGKYKRAWALAVDEKTSVVVDKNGAARVMGAGPAYLILADHRPEVCAPGQPLTYSNYKLWKMASGQSFSLKERPKTGYYLVSVEKGKILSNPYEATAKD